MKWYILETYSLKYEKICSRWVSRFAVVAEQIGKLAAALSELTSQFIFRK